jgi:very-short-patch-repair endonuclease
MKHYSPQALERARRLRRTSTDTERALWRLLRSRGLAQFKFRRQKPIAGYIADFACLEWGLIIELDGGHHPQQEHHDAVRTRKLQDAGSLRIP